MVPDGDIITLMGNSFDHSHSHNNPPVHKPSLHPYTRYPRLHIGECGSEIPFFCVQVENIVRQDKNLLFLPELLICEQTVRPVHFQFSQIVAFFVDCFKPN